jgi:hydroxymethylbilane synthase
MQRTIKIGTRESELAVWQANLVKSLLAKNNINAELVYVKSEGDIDLVTPLYAMGVQGVFTRTLDAALLNDRIDIAVHSMKDVPTQLPEGIRQASILKRASYKDILVYQGEGEEVKLKMKRDSSMVNGESSKMCIATSSIRRKAQWLHRYPEHTIENLRGNVNTRLRKVVENIHWDGAIFAAAGLERINLRPENSIELDWMLPAPAQGAIMVACRENDQSSFEACRHFNDEETALFTKIERDFLKTLLGGCSTPISALAKVNGGIVTFRGNICSTDGTDVVEIKKEEVVADAGELGIKAAEELLSKPRVIAIMQQIRDAKG